MKGLLYPLYSNAGALLLIASHPSGHSCSCAAQYPTMGLSDGGPAPVSSPEVAVCRLEPHPYPALLRTPGPRLLAELHPNPTQAAGWWPENLLLFLFSFILTKRQLGPAQ